MIISMKLHATRQEIDEVTDQVKRFGYKVHSIEGEERRKHRIARIRFANIFIMMRPRRINHCQITRKSFERVQQQ